MIISTKNTKEQILALLKQYGNMTIMELSQELEITEMAVRRHIQTLERDKLIRSEVKKQTMGRPSKVYQLAEQGENFFPKRYKELGLELLQGLKDAGQEELIKEILLKRREKFIEQYNLEHPNASFKDRIKNLKEFLNLEGHMPEVETQNGTVDFKEFNCPYVEIAKEFPVLCKTEREFIKKFLNTELTPMSSMAEGHTCCHYTVQERT